MVLRFDGLSVLREPEVCHVLISTAVHRRGEEVRFLPGSRQGDAIGGMAPAISEEFEAHRNPMPRRPLLLETFEDRILSSVTAPVLEVPEDRKSVV